jgi:hypothetical protein
MGMFIKQFDKHEIKWNNINAESPNESQIIHLFKFCKEQTEVTVEFSNFFLVLQRSMYSIT